MKLRKFQEAHETEGSSSNGRPGVVATIMPVITITPRMAIIVDVPPVVANLFDLHG